MTPVYHITGISRRVNNLLLFLQLRLYGNRDVPRDQDPCSDRATEIPVKRDKLYPYKRNIPVHRDEVKLMKFKTTSDKGKPPKKETKGNNIRWDAIYVNKISFRFIDKLLSTFPRFFE